MCVGVFVCISECLKKGKKVISINLDHCVITQTFATWIERRNNESTIVKLINNYCVYTYKYISIDLF